MEKRTIISQSNKLYLRASKREAATWSRSLTVGQRARKPRNHSLISKYYSSIISGDQHEIDWIWWFSRNYEKFGHALSLGSGFGLTEEQMLRADMFERLDVVDLSRDAVTKFKKRIDSHGLKTEVHPRIGDLNFIQLPTETYDFILAHTSLHHIINLEHLLEQIRQSLKPGGIFLIYDFIGASAWQWSAKTLKEVNLAIELSRPRFPELTFHQVGRPLKSRVINHSPFESVRSADIVELLHSGFEPIREVFTDRLLHVLLHYGVELDQWDSPTLNRWLKEMIDWEDGIASGSEVPPCTLWGIYQKRETPLPVPAGWTDDDIRERIGVSSWNPRGIALSVLDSVPYHDAILRAWMKLKRKKQWY